MDQNILFRWIWRLNALGLLAVLTVALLAFVPLFGPSMVGQTTIFSPYPGATTAAVGPNELFLDYSRPGRDQIVLVLAPPSGLAEYQRSVLPDMQDSTRLSARFADMKRVANYLFIDPASGAARWLFPTNDQTITTTDYVTDTDIAGAPPPPAWVAPPPAPTRPPVVVLYDVTPSAAKAGGENAKRALYVSKVDGTQLTKLLDDLDGPASETVHGDTLTARYQAKGRQMVATFSLADFKAIMTKDVTDLAGK